ncbi:hypothetical protein P167DRAFT_538670 [Morchella conica CCBAS932]|uniref:Uncharacterized protein n=1 Tax=Morchella conica CCBAS932 TaxID=1392247 RepID=A0A3N4KIQ8_9PEZI|nr:hypothetical protein P167DRAFT_538670 [Morchella conica CCBAS932]
MAVRDLRPIEELGFGRQGQITANRTIRQDPPSVGERLYIHSTASRKKTVGHNAAFVSTVVYITGR